MILVKPKRGITNKSLDALAVWTGLSKANLQSGRPSNPLGQAARLHGRRRSGGYLWPPPPKKTWQLPSPLAAGQVRYKFPSEENQATKE